MTAEEFARLGFDRIASIVRDVVGDVRVYLSFDIDSLNPAFAPGTGTPEVGGLTSPEVGALLRELKGCNLVGGDGVEVVPFYEATDNTSRITAQVLFGIVSLVKFGKRLRQPSDEGEPSQTRNQSSEE